MVFLALGLSGCIGPKVNACLLDLNVFDRAIESGQETWTKADVKNLVHTTAPWYCVPPGAKDTSKDFHLVLKTGQHGYSAEDWGILMRWIVDHTK